MSSLHFFTIFCRSNTEEAEATVKSARARRLNLDRLTVYKEVVVGHFLPRPNGSASVVTQMKDSSLDPEPARVQSKFRKLGFMTLTIAGIALKRPKCAYGRKSTGRS